MFEGSFKIGVLGGKENFRLSQKKYVITKDGEELLGFFNEFEVVGGVYMAFYSERTLVDEDEEEVFVPLRRSGG